MPNSSGVAEELARKVMKMHEAHEFDRIDEVLVEDCEVTVAGETYKGLDQMRGMMRSFSTAFPDLVHHVEAVVGGTDEEVSLELRITATHDGPFVTALGEIPATGNTVEWYSGNFVPVNVDGDRLKSWHIYLDQLTILGQIGYEALGERLSEYRCCPVGC